MALLEDADDPDLGENPSFVHSHSMLALGGTDVVENSTAAGSHPMLALGRPSTVSSEIAGEVRKRKLFAGLGLIAHEIPERFGRYSVLEEVGQGGMGTVLTAYDKQLDRAVAIKVLRSDSAKRDGIRLKREAQALAKLSHPNVVHVYEVGEVDGQTFVAMELVKRGQTLAEWARREPRPGWRECVQVYLQAGAGLAAAHAEGLVHRDFKPSNVIIDDKGLVRVLDFGLARQIKESIQDSNEHTTPGINPGGNMFDVPLTRTDAVVGTLRYMSLEQLEGKSVDARSDQFSFCVALWETMCGQRPFFGDTIEDLRAQLVEGRIDLTNFDTSIPVKLREVLERGLATRPEDRWGSMEELLEQLRRLAAQGRRGLIRSLGLLGGLGLLGVGLAYQAEVAQRCTGASAQLEGIWDDTRRAEVEAAFAATRVAHAPETWKRVEARLDDYTRNWTEMYIGICEATAVRHEQSPDAMDLRMSCLSERKRALLGVTRTLARVDEKAVGNALALVAELPELSRCDDLDALMKQQQRVPLPADQWTMRRVEALHERLAIIKAEDQAGNYIEALKQLEPVEEEAQTSGYAPLTCEVKIMHGWLLARNSLFEPSERMLSEAYATAVALRIDGLVMNAAMSLAIVFGEQPGREAEGLPYVRVALALAKHRREPVMAALTLNQAAKILIAQRKFEEAEQELIQATQNWEAASEADHPGMVISMVLLGQALQGQKRYEDAERMYGRALERQERGLGEGHPDLGGTVDHLGYLLMLQGRYTEAEKEYRRALQLRTHSLGENHPEVATSLNNLGYVLQFQERYEEAEHEYRRASDIFRREFGANSRLVAKSLTDIGSMLMRQGRYEEAESYHRRALQIWEHVAGEVGLDVANSMYFLGDALRLLGRLDEAELLLRRALSILSDEQGNPGYLSGSAISSSLALLLFTEGRYEEAEGQFSQAMEMRRRVFGEEYAYDFWGVAEYGFVLYMQGKYNEADRVLRQALSVVESESGDKRSSLADILQYLAMTSSALERYDEAERLLQRAVDVLEQRFGPDDSRVAIGVGVLGEVVMVQGRFDEATQLFDRAAEDIEAKLGSNSLALTVSLDGLGYVSYAEGRYKDAERYLRRSLEIKENGLDSDDLALADGEVALGQALLARSKNRQAKQHYMRALLIREDVLGEGHLDVADALVGLAEVELAIRDTASARRFAERAVTICESDDTDLMLLADARFVLARALWEHRAERDQAKKLVQLALEDYLDAGVDEDHLATILQWMEQRAVDYERAGSSRGREFAYYVDAEGTQMPIVASVRSAEVDTDTGR